MSVNHSTPVRLRLALAMAAVVLFTLPTPAQPQGFREEIVPALVGGTLGLAGGGYVAVGIVTLQARRGNHLYSARDALGWESSPILIGAGTGFFLGITDEDRLRRAVLGGLVAGFVGTGIGMAYGEANWAPPEGRWAGGVIGGAAGLILGVVTGALLPPGDEKEDRPPVVIPVSISVPF